MSERVARELTCILRALCHDAALTPQLGEVVTRLLTTAGQVLLRFSQYAEYAARAVLMSRKYNSDTYYQEVVRILHVDTKALDSGYCQPLRREALGAAGRSSGSQTERFCTSSRSRRRRSLARSRWPSNRLPWTSNESTTSTGAAKLPAFHRCQKHRGMHS